MGLPFFIWGINPCIDHPRQTSINWMPVDIFHLRFATPSEKKIISVLQIACAIKKFVINLFNLKN
jgi:hypothetical protein